MRKKDKFEFTTNWFESRDKTTFEKYVLPQYKDKPTTYVELGVFEGRSLTWMLQNVLAHPESRAVGVDPWLMMPKRDTANMEAVRERALRNLSPWTSTGKCQLFRSTSAEFLLACRNKGGIGGITENSVDLIFIDGNHWAPFVLYDAMNALPLMRKGGLILFDDVVNDRKKNEDHVKEGIQMFLDKVSNQVKQVFQHRYMEGYVVA